MKRFIYIQILTLLFLTVANNAHAIVGGTAVSDFEAHKKLNTVNKYLLEQKDIIDANGDTLAEIKDAITGINTNTYSITGSESLKGDISDVKVPNIMKGKEIRIINIDLDKMYPTQDLEVSENTILRSKQKQQQQSELKQIIVYATNIINNSQTRDSEIEILAMANTQTKKLKETMDLQNKIALENLIELKKNNILLASLVRNQAKERYSGLIDIKTEQPSTEAEKYYKSGFKNGDSNSKYNRMLGR